MAPLIPELTEISAPLVCRIATPQEFTSHLVIEADHECLNEARIGGEGGNRVGWNVLHARQHVALGERKQSVIHRSGEFGRDHHWFKGVRCFADVRPDDALLKAPDNAHLWVQAAYQYRSGCIQVQWPLQRGLPGLTSGHKALMS